MSSSPTSAPDIGITTVIEEGEGVDEELVWTVDVITGVNVKVGDATKTVTIESLVQVESSPCKGLGPQSMGLLGPLRQSNWVKSSVL